MTPRDRIVVEILVPAPLGTALWITWHFTEIRHSPGLAPEVLAPYFLLAYAFALIPSCIYALLVEWSLGAIGGDGWVPWDSSVSRRDWERWLASPFGAHPKPT